MKIAIVGAGGVGGYFGGRLSQAGHEVTFVARGAHLAALRERGLRVDSVAGDFVIDRVCAVGSAAEAAPADAVLVCVKAWQVPEVAPTLGPLLGPDTFVVPLENGVEAADQLASVIGAERVAFGLCKILSFVAGPGHIRHVGVLPRVEIGERREGGAGRVEALRAAFASCIGVSVGTPEDIEAAVWEKFLFIAPFGGVGAVTRMPAGVLRVVPESRALLQQAMTEVFMVARARRIALGEDTIARTMAYVDGLPADATASMQRDLLEGRPSELEYQNGAIVRLGGAAGVAVPVNAFIYAALLPGELRTRGRLPAAETTNA